MKPYATVGVILVVLGIAALAYQRVTYTSREKVVDIGPIEATADRQRTIPLPPVLGAMTVVLGGVLIALSMRRTA